MHEPSTDTVRDHLAANRANWDDRAPLHAARVGSGYETGRYVDDRALLSDVVAFDRDRLGHLSGLDVVHLQCHIGTDTLSLARLGASSVVGLDFSAASIEEARSLVAETGDEVSFVRADVHDAVEVLGAERFDLVYTGIGALCWLPSAERWARVVAGLLRPGGRLLLREGHPLVWAIDERLEDDLHLRFSYFEQPEPLKWVEDATYVETERPLTATTTYTWNHGIGEIITALLDAGLTLTAVVEHQTLPWQALPGQMVAAAGGEWALAPERDGVAPLSYTIEAVKPGQAHAGVGRS